VEETARPSALVLSDQIKCYLLVIAVTECRHDSKALWSKLSVLLRPSTATSISEVPCTRCDVTTDQRQLQCTTRLRVRSCRVHHLHRGRRHVFKKHGVGYHLSADDKQAYVDLLVQEIDQARSTLQHCISDVRSWCSFRHEDCS